MRRIYYIKRRNEMNNEEFMIEVEKAHLRSKRLLLRKEKEYTSGGSRLDQFYRAGAAQDVSPTEALMGMATKHITSIADMCKDPTSYNLKKWREKTTDLRNYTLLLDALLVDMEIE